MTCSGIVILEGADASGKSTLAAYLRERRGARVMHCRVWRDMERWHRGVMRRAVRLARAGELVVLDRHWPSELIYGPIFRGGAAYGDDLAEEFDLQVRRAPGVYVLCVPSDLKAQVARHRERRAAGGEEFDAVATVAARYADLLMGNVAHPGGNLVDRFIRYGDFCAGRRVVRYDLDLHGGDIAWVASRALSELNR